jgi:hypothetical protein
VPVAESRKSHISKCLDWNERGLLISHKFDAKRTIANLAVKVRFEPNLTDAAKPTDGLKPNKAAVQVISASAGETANYVYGFLVVSTGRCR